MTRGSSDIKDQRAKPAICFTPVLSIDASPLPPLFGMAITSPTCAYYIYPFHLWYVNCKSIRYDLSIHCVTPRSSVKCVDIPPTTGCTKEDDPAAIGIEPHLPIQPLLLLVAVAMYYPAGSYLSVQKYICTCKVFGSSYSLGAIYLQVLYHWQPKRAADINFFFKEKGMMLVTQLMLGKP